MKKAILTGLILLMLPACLAACTTKNDPPVTGSALPVTGVTDVTTETKEPTPVKQTYIHPISELNTVSERDSHVDDVYIAALESNFREYISLKPSFLGATLSYYPRVKLLSDGKYILIYQNGQHGPDVRYCLSDDGINYGEPQNLFTGTPDTLYSTADAAVLANGDLLVVASYRYSSSYLNNPMKCGLIARRSSDCGKTWSEPQIIYVGCTWEPSVLQLKSGEIQVYWTNTTGLNTSNGVFTSTGTAIIRSFDNGYTWTGDKSQAFTGQIVSQSKTEVIGGVQFFSEQMPVACELHNGIIALALEVRLDRNHNFRISVSNSDDNWATALAPFEEEGPADKLNRFRIGAGPYMRQFESGETVICYARKTLFTYSLGDENARNFGAEYTPYEGLSTNYWGMCELIAPHTLLTANEYVVENGATSLNFIVSGRLYLNHRINAARMADSGTWNDPDNKAWSGDNTDALFVGSVSQAQMSTRAAYDDKNLYLYCERLDYDNAGKDDSATLLLTGNCRDRKYLILSFDAEGVTRVSYYDGAKSDELDAKQIGFSALINEADSAKDPQAGYAAHIAIPLALLDNLDNPAEGVYTDIILYNADGGKKSDKDTLTGAEVADPETWYRVSFGK